MTRRSIAITGIVAILVIVLVSHMIHRHQVEVQKANEQTLKDNLAEMRRALQSYEADHHEKAHALADLTPAYLRVIPTDPVTRSNSTWRVSVEETVRIDDFAPAAPTQAAPSIIDVHSGAPGLDSTGRPYSDY